MEKEVPKKPAQDVQKPQLETKPLISVDDKTNTNLRQTLTRIIVKDNLRNNEQLIYFSC